MQNNSNACNSIKMKRKKILAYCNPKITGKNAKDDENNEGRRRTRKQRSRTRCRKRPNHNSRSFSMKLLLSGRSLESREDIKGFLSSDFQSLGAYIEEEIRVRRG